MGTGGPINGSGEVGKTKFARRGANTILVPTVLQVSLDVMQMFSGITCLFDPGFYNRQDVVALPLCFFYVKSLAETIKITTSEKRVILYDPQMNKSMAELGGVYHAGVQEIITDNVIAQPKEYQMEIILPFQLGQGLFTRQMNELAQLFEAFVEVLGGADVGAFGLASSVISQVKLASAGIQASAKLPGSSSAAYINKNSLEVMAQSQRIVTMKMWTGFDYKYAIITGVDFKKNGNEDDIYRATVTMKELPVLTVNPANDATTPGAIDRNLAATLVVQGNNMLIAPLVSLTGVGAASQLDDAQAAALLGGVQ